MINPQIRKWFLISVALLLLFIFESSLLPWLIPPIWRTELLIYPKLVLVSILFISMFSNRRIGVLYGLALGLLQDAVFYGHMIGVNSFAYAICAYIAGLIVKPPTILIVPVFFIQLLSLLLYELTTFAIYRLFNIYDAPFGWVFTDGMLPSALVGLFFALALYLPARKWLESPSVERETDEES